MEGGIGMGGNDGVRLLLLLLAPGIASDRKLPWRGRVRLRFSTESEGGDRLSPVCQAR
jgi:hypothetical protein